MGWTAHYQLVRDRILDARELEQLAKLVRSVQKRKWDGEAFGLVAATAPRPSRVIARGWNKLGMSQSSFDRTLLEQTLDKVRELVPDAQVRVADDLQVLGKLSTLADETDNEWTSVLSIVPPPPAKHPALLDAALASTAAGRPLDETVRTNVELARKLFTALGKHEIDKAPLRALADAMDPDVLSQLALSTYARLDTDARSVVRAALERVRDPVALTDAFLHAWTTPRGLYYYGDMQIPPAFIAVLGAQPSVRTRWTNDIDAVESGTATSDLDARRAERAARMLGESKHPAALACLAALVRRWRTRDVPHTMCHYGYLPALRFLAEAASPAWTATTLLALDGRGTLRTGEAQAIECSTLGDRAIAIPVLRALLDQGIGIDEAMIAIARLGSDAAPLEDAVTPYLAYPSAKRRSAARTVIASIRRAPPPDDDYEKVGPEALVAHRDIAVRHAALRSIHERKDPSLFVALVHAERIDAALRASVGWDSLPFSWHDWKGIVPKEFANARPHQRIAWARGEGATKLGPQRELAAITPLVDLEAHAIRSHYGPLTFTLDDATREMLLARERSSFGE